MPHQISWLLDDRILYTEFFGVITAEELSDFIDDVLATARTGTPMVHHISNSLQLERVEFSLGTARAMLKGRHFTAELGWQIDINRNPMNKMFAEIISQFAGVRTRTFASLPEAFDFLAENDTSLSYVDWEALLAAQAEETLPLR